MMDMKEKIVRTRSDPYKDNSGNVAIKSIYNPPSLFLSPIFHQSPRNPGIRYFLSTLPFQPKPPLTRAFHAIFHTRAYRHESPKHPQVAPRCRDTLRCGALLPSGVVGTAVRDRGTGDHVEHSTKRHPVHSERGRIAIFSYRYLLWLQIARQLGVDRFVR